MRRILMMAGLLVLPAALFSSTTIIGATAPVTTEPTPVMALPLTLAAPIAALDECALLCDDLPTGCAEGEHDAYDAGPQNPEWFRAGGSHPPPPNHCFEGSCDTKHGECGVSLASFAMSDFETLRASLAMNDISTVRAIIAEHADQLTINHARAAVQVSNCRGTLVAHIPLSADALR